MANFPKVEYVTYETDDIPKFGKVKFRAFLVGEYMKLLEASEMKDPSAILETMVNIIDACTFGKLPVKTLEMYILDYLYLQIYIKSKGSKADATFTCSNDVDGGICNTSVGVKIPLDMAKLEFPDNYKETSIIRLGEESGIKLKQPSMDDFKKIKDSESIYDIDEEFLFSSIDCIFDGDRIMVPGTDFTLPELMEYVKSLPGNIIDEVKSFFDSSPKMVLELPIKCPKCGHTENIKLEGLDDFFGL